MKPTKKKPAKRKTTGVDRFRGDTFWGGVLMKLKKLGTAIEMKKGPSMNIDDHDQRWVDDRINYLQSEGRTLSKEEMEQANEYWRIYGRQIMSWELIKAILCFTLAGVGIYVVWLLAKDEDRREF